jgi:hypothetical protein
VLNIDARNAKAVTVANPFEVPEEWSKLLKEVRRGQRVDRSSARLDRSPRRVHDGKRDTDNSRLSMHDAE